MEFTYANVLNIMSSDRVQVSIRSEYWGWGTIIEERVLQTGVRQRRPVESSGTGRSHNSLGFEVPRRLLEMCSKFLVIFDIYSVNYGN